MNLKFKVFILKTTAASRHKLDHWIMKTIPGQIAIKILRARPRNACYWKLPPSAENQCKNGTKQSRGTREWREKRINFFSQRSVRGGGILPIHIAWVTSPIQSIADRAFIIASPPDVDLNTDGRNIGAGGKGAHIAAGYYILCGWVISRRNSSIYINSDTVTCGWSRCALQCNFKLHCWCWITLAKDKFRCCVISIFKGYDRKNRYSLDLCVKYLPCNSL